MAKNTDMDLTGENPYLSARRVWNDRLSSLVTSRMTWQFVAIVAMMFGLAAWGENAYLRSQSHLIPYVVTMDKLGEPVRVQVLPPAQSLPPQVIEYQLADWLQSARMVSPDRDLETRAIYHVFDEVVKGSQANAMLNRHFQQHPPLQRAAHEIVTTRITSVLQQTPLTWEVDWQETTTPRGAQVPLPPENWKALITVKVVKPSSMATMQDILKNPTGLMIDGLSWSKVI